MNAYEIETSIAEGREGFESLFEWVRQNADQFEAHEMEAHILQKLISIGLAALKTYFAQRGTGERGEAIRRDDGVLLEKESGLHPRRYVSLFGVLPVPRTCYRSAGEPGIFPLDEEVNFPERCYSYYLQEWMNLLSLDHPFAEGAERLQHFFGVLFVESGMVLVAREGARDYDTYYAQKTPPAPTAEGELVVV